MRSRAGKMRGDDPSNSENKSATQHDTPRAKAPKAILGTLSVLANVRTGRDTIKATTVDYVHIVVDCLPRKSKLGPIYELRLACGEPAGKQIFGQRPRGTNTSRHYCSLFRPRLCARWLSKHIDRR